jgi:hypothetical protein
MTAAVVGTAASVGTSHANKKAAEQQQEAATQQQLADQNAGIAALQAQQAAAPAPVYAAPAPVAAAPAVDPVTAQLQNLASLHAAGILSDEEFAAAKAKALGI